MFESLSEKLEGALQSVTGQGRINELNIASSMREVRRALLDADVNYQVARDFTNRVKEQALGEDVLTSVKPGQQLVKIVYDELTDLLGGEQVSVEMAERPPTVILIAGLQGSGKTTTLYAAIRELATGEVNIMTVEDPVEYELPGITQIQVQPKRGVTFASALRAILRQDPDVILVGEIRDLETAEVAVQQHRDVREAVAMRHRLPPSAVTTHHEVVGPTHEAGRGHVVARVDQRELPADVDARQVDLPEADAAAVAFFGVEQKRHRRPLDNFKLPSAEQVDDDRRGNGGGAGRVDPGHPLLECLIAGRNGLAQNRPLIFGKRLRTVKETRARAAT